MTRLDAVIKDIEAVNKVGNVWIYDVDGEIKDDVICGNVLELLYELRDYELDLPKGAINWVVENADRRWNTYNWNANIDHDIDVAEMHFDGYTYMAIMVHRYGDVRANYTDRFLVRFDNEYEWFELNSRMQCKEIADGRYYVDIDIMAECYNVWDNEKEVNVGEFYELEVEDLLNEINQKFSKTSYK